MCDICSYDTHQLRTRVISVVFSYDKHRSRTSPIDLIGHKPFHDGSFLVNIFETFFSKIRLDLQP